MVKYKGFTLIELLVVIAIIALLLAILMPALGMVKFHAKVVVCKTNFHQWGLSSFLYAEDYSGKFPRYDFPSTGGNTWDVSNEFVLAMMNDYEMNSKMFFCPVTVTPEDRGAMGNNEETIALLKLPYDYFSRMRYNLWIPRKTGSLWIPAEPEDPEGFPVGTSDKKCVSRPIMTDILGNNVKPDVYDENTMGGHRLGGVLKSTNLLFGDGHVEVHKPDEMEVYHFGNYHNFF